MEVTICVKFDPGFAIAINPLIAISVNCPPGANLMCPTSANHLEMSIQASILLFAQRGYKQQMSLVSNVNLAGGQPTSFQTQC